MINKDVTMVTHCTVDQMYHLMEMSDRWDGPMSGIDFLKTTKTKFSGYFSKYIRTDESSPFLTPVFKKMSIKGMNIGLVKTKPTDLFSTDGTNQSNDGPRIPT